MGLSVAAAGDAAVSSLSMSITACAQSGVTWRLCIEAYMETNAADRPDARAIRQLQNELSRCENVEGRGSDRELDLSGRPYGPRPCRR